MTNKKELENPPHFVVISSNQDLYDVCLQAERKSAIALDTEFVRTRTYYAQLGLIQLYDGEQVSLIDPNDIDDFSPFIHLLANPQVVKGITCRQRRSGSISALFSTKSHTNV